jgi:hypothetical protein
MLANHITDFRHFIGRQALICARPRSVYRSRNNSVNRSRHHLGIYFDEATLLVESENVSTMTTDERMLMTPLHPAMLDKASKWIEDRI